MVSGQSGAAPPDRHEGFQVRIAVVPRAALPAQNIFADLREPPREEASGSLSRAQEADLRRALSDIEAAFRP